MHDGSISGPFGRAAWEYRSRGWHVIPLPAGQKSPPPHGFTGWAGVAPSGADIQAWLDGGAGSGNIALTLRGGEAGEGYEIFGIDVDAYGGKGGAAALAALTERAGEPLPPTWVSTSRADGISGIRFYRATLPAGRVWIDQPGGTGAGIETVHRGHRYAVVAPSVHPDTGTEYAWLGAEGLPVAGELPVLPEMWAEVLSRPGEVIAGTAAGHAETLAAVDQFRRTGDGGLECGPVKAARERFLAALAPGRVVGEALHPTANGDIWEIAALGWEGHHGARDALALHYGAFLRARGDVRAEGRDKAAAEWWRMVRGAAGKLAATRGTPAGVCSCEAVLFDVGVPAGVASVGGDPFGPADGGPDPPATATQTADGDQIHDPVARLIAAMLTPAQMRERPAPVPLVSGLLLLDSLAWLVAAPGSYKSFVALDLAASVDSGKPWMGRTVRRGSVVYICAEGAGGMGLRVRAREARYGQMNDVLFLPLPVQVSDSLQWGTLIEACRRLRPSLIVVDTQARVTVGMKENDNTDMGVFVDAAGRLRQACGACVLTIHHSPKEGAGLRGAGGLEGAADSILELVRRGKLFARLTARKQKDLESDVRIDLGLDVVDLGFNPSTGERLSSLVVMPDGAGVLPVEMPDWIENLTENQSVIVGVIADIFPERGATKAQTEKIVKERVRPSDGKVVGHSSFSKAWDALVGKGTLMQVQGSQRFVLASLHGAEETRPEVSDVLAALSARYSGDGEGDEEGDSGGDKG